MGRCWGQAHSQCPRLRHTMGHAWIAAAPRLHAHLTPTLSISAPSPLLWLCLPTHTPPPRLPPPRQPLIPSPPPHPSCTHTLHPPSFKTSPSPHLHHPHPSHPKHTCPPTPPSGPAAAPAQAHHQPAQAGGLPGPTQSCPPPSRACPPAPAAPNPGPPCPRPACAGTRGRRRCGGRGAAWLPRWSPLRGG